MPSALKGKEELLDRMEFLSNCSRSLSRSNLPYDTKMLPIFVVAIFWGGRFREKECGNRSYNSLMARAVKTLLDVIATVWIPCLRNRVASDKNDLPRIWWL